MEIHNKVAVVTGAGSGIGRATAVRLAHEGAAVVVVDVDDVGARETAARIGQHGGNATSIAIDVTDVANLHRMIDVATDQFGGVDILYNNAGITCGALGYPDAPPATWQRVLDVNLRAVILGTQLAIPALRRRGGGVIIHTASLAGFVGYPPDPVYAATKAAVVLFTHSLAGLAAEGIRVNCVCPGVVNTPMLRGSQAAERPTWLSTIPMLEPEDIADAVVQLIRDDSLAGRALRIAPGLLDFADLPTFHMSPSDS